MTSKIWGEAFCWEVEFSLGLQGSHRSTHAPDETTPNFDISHIKIEGGGIWESPMCMVKPPLLLIPNLLVPEPQTFWNITP